MNLDLVLLLTPVRGFRLEEKVVCGQTWFDTPHVSIFASWILIMFLITKANPNPNN